MCAWTLDFRHKQVFDTNHTLEKENEQSTRHTHTHTKPRRFDKQENKLGSKLTDIEGDR